MYMPAAQPSSVVISTFAGSKYAGGSRSVLIRVTYTSGSGVQERTLPSSGSRVSRHSSDVPLYRGSENMVTLSPVRRALAGFKTSGIASEIGSIRRQIAKSVSGTSQTNSISQTAASPPISSGVSRNSK